MKRRLKFLPLLVLLLASTLTSCLKSEKEELLVGSWVLSNYSDNGVRTTPEEAQAYQTNVANLLINLEFNEDGTFYRLFGDKATNQKNEFRGTWYFENDERLLVMNIEKQPESKLLLKELTEDKLTLEVEEDGIATTLAFARK
jgi:hypothetical protein